MYARHERAQSGAIIAVALGVVVLLAFVGAALFIASLGSSESESGADVYVSIGDSIAAGNGASDAESSSFAALLAARQEVSLFNLAKAGATTDDVLSSQLAQALGPIQAGRARFVTISAGGNDLAALIPNQACVEQPLPASCPLAETLAGVRERLDAILRYIREANRRVPVVVLAYPNFFSGTGHAWEAPAGRVLPMLNEVIRHVAAGYERVAVAEPGPAFDGNGDDLTHVLDEQFDPHPNDAGHRAIADAFAQALQTVD